MLKLKTKKQYVCNNCGTVGFKWSGKCGECHEWNSIVEEVVNKTPNSVALGQRLEVSVLDNIVCDQTRIVTPINEFNRVLGGGLVPGGVVLIGGDPGIGKSTLLLQLTISLTKESVSCIYVTGEESINQVKLRAARLTSSNLPLKLLAATNVHDIIETIKSYAGDIKLVIIDSIQTMYDPNISSTTGTVSQLRSVSNELIAFAKKENIILVLIGHITKDGQLAGPKLLEHMVDTVLYFEGNNDYQYRMLRAIKNRFGNINEIGVFEMQTEGLVEVSNPSEMFLLEREVNNTGTSVFANLEGSRPIMVEVQALIALSPMPMPRRSVVGWDTNRLSMILAVLSVRYGLSLISHEVYLSIVGGVKIIDPAIDLAVIAALLSAATNKILPEKSIFFGEVGLSGEVRTATRLDLRIKEAQKLGFKKIFCAPSKQLKSSNFDISITTLSHIKQLENSIL